MIKEKKKLIIIKSIGEFEKRYLPKMVEERKIKELKRSKQIGIWWAKETMQKVKKIIEE